jgi:hypothetical protein
MLAMRDIILSLDKDVTNEMKYGMPFFSYKKKMFCYLWVHKKLLVPYLGIVEGKRFDDPELIQDKRSRMKIMMLDPQRDLKVRKIKRLLTEVLDLYRKGVIKV